MLVLNLLLTVILNKEDIKFSLFAWVLPFLFTLYMPVLSANMIAFISIAESTTLDNSQL